MRLQIRAKNFRLPEAVQEEMNRRIRFALGRFVGRISLVTVSLTDVNGPRRGMDKQCRLVVRLIPSGKVTIEEEHGDAATAVALAADRAGWNVGRELKRQRDTRYGRRTSEMLPDGWRSLESYPVESV